MQRTTKRTERNWQGMNWIRQETRLAIYLRDGCACAYCGRGIEVEGVKLTLDHLMPHSVGGVNHPRNLITACSVCNTSRGNKFLTEFIVVVAAYWNRDVADISRHINNARKRDMRKYRTEARSLIGLRGSAAKVMAARKLV